MSIFLKTLDFDAVFPWDSNMCRTSRLSSSYGFSLVVEEEEDGGVMPTRYFSRAACALLEGASRTHTS